MRRVRFTITSIQTGELLTEKHEGYFHKWGTKIAPGGPISNQPVSCAIIEDENGVIHEVAPSDVVFLDRPQES